MKLRGLLLIVVALVIGACGGAADLANEELIEQIVEAGGDGDVEIDIGDDSVSVEVESDDGSFAIGSDVATPDDLTFPLPDGGQITTAGSQGGYVFVAAYYPQERYEEIVSFYKDWASGDSRDWGYSEGTTAMDDLTLRNASWREGASNISVNDCVSPSGEFDSVCVTLNETT